MIAANGVSSDGFNTTGEPAAKAPANFNDVWLVGKFHGVTKPATPIPSLTTKSSPRRSSNSILSIALLASLKWI